MTPQTKCPKWIMYRHTSNFNYLCDVAERLKTISKTNITKAAKKQLNLNLKNTGLYSERNPEMTLDAINHKINQLAHYMFGYKTKMGNVDRFMFSPLGNLLLKHRHNKEKSAKIFLAMLWALQYQHPHGGTDKEFQLYPFRLIYKLLSDIRLEFRLYAYEVSFLLVFIKNIDNATYEKLVNEILKLRDLSDQELSEKFQTDRHNYVNSAYEWDYYVTEFFKDAGVLEKTEGKVICKLQHGKTATFRKITRNFVMIPYKLRKLVSLFESQYSFLDKPLLLNDSERLNNDVIKEIYSFYPNSLLVEIEEHSDSWKLLELPKLIEKYSNNPENEAAYLFEEVLEKGFNMFYNVEAKRIGGSGNTDIECLYITSKKKFAVESKSTANKLVAINVGRLREHREAIGGAYTIVITSRYVPAAERDIVESPVVIILANTFAEYLYNCIDNDVREIDYADFDDIIANNLGTDVSEKISNMTISKFSVVGVK